MRYSYTRNNEIVYKFPNTKGIGFITTKRPNRGRAKIYLNGKYITTIDAHKSSEKARQLIFYRGFSKKGTQYLKIVNLGTPGRARFDIDGVVVKR